MAHHTCVSGAKAQLTACPHAFRVATSATACKRASKPDTRTRANLSCQHMRSTNIHHGPIPRQRSSVVVYAAQQSGGEASTALQPDMTKTKVLFVCKGNICRSPAAGSVLEKVVQSSGVADDFEIDSCGTGGSGHENWFKLDSKDHWEEHKDRTVDDRMVDALKKRNLDPTSDSRPMEPEDFQKFDFVVCMNQENVEEVQKAGQYWQDEAKKPLPQDWKDKIQLMSKYLIKNEHQGESEVPDPFHGGPDHFEVLDLLEDACEGFVAHVDSRKFATES